ncbi:MAG: GNAT family N-acetyltransferase [Endozoicomonas sp.]|uniref:GNAT family N-acetyltransferase n=1 Tax=Endozoicomonas sp. TaxID=1892382 RepID=UPI003D9B6BA9
MIELRELNESDIEPLVRNGNNKKVSRYLVESFPSPYTRENAEWWVSTGCQAGINRAILWHGEFAGVVGATPGTLEQRKQASIGYWLGEPFWGKGIAAEAVKQLSKEIFETTEVVRLFAGVFSPNKASMRVLEKAGYSEEAVLKKAAYKDDCFYDEHIFTQYRQGL